jgi:hypothetical protein
MSDDQESDEKRCPVCKTHTAEDNLQSQGLILSGMKALFDGDTPTIENIYEIMTQYDGHTAIGLAAALLNDLCVILGSEPDDFLTAYRAGLNHAQAHGV